MSSRRTGSWRIGEPEADLTINWKRFFLEVFIFESIKLFYDLLYGKYHHRFKTPICDKINVEELIGDKVDQIY